MTCVPRWRLVVDAAGSGPWNMGVDEALFASARESDVASLRLYRWQGAWLSLGYAQKLEAERLAACEAAQVGVVRRRTGGLAVLHGADLTYSVAAPEAVLPSGLQASYALIADVLIATLGTFGIRVERRVAGAPSGEPRGFDCFAAQAADELVVAGRKLVGSAQRRAGGAVLQHGSIRLRADSSHAGRAAGLDQKHATSLEELGWRGGRDALARELSEQFARQLGVSLQADPLTSTERAQAAARQPELAKPPRVDSHLGAEAADLRQVFAPQGHQ